MAVVLSDPALYVFTGGGPPTVNDLSLRYARQVVGHSPDGQQQWLNFIVRRCADAAPIGYVQATVDGGRADIAWVIGTPFQRQGYAQEAAQLLVDTLQALGIFELSAHIHPDHLASATVATTLGMIRTDTIEDGEHVWVLAG